MIAFKDLNPQAPMHVLVVPRKHVATLNDLTAAEDGLVGAMVARLERRVAFSLSVSERELYLSIGTENLLGSVVRLALDVDG